MPYMCDALLPVEERNASLKYRRTSRWFNPWRALPEDNREVRAMMLTPGLLPIHVFALMRWDRNMKGQLRALEAIDDVDDMVHANVMGVDQRDGEAMLRSMLANFPNWSRSIPLWSTRFLQARRLQGSRPGELARELGTTPRRVATWWRADLFDPLTGVSYKLA